MTQGRSVKSAMCRESGSWGGCVPPRIGSVNVGSLKGRDSEIVDIAERASGLLLSPGD